MDVTAAGRKLITSGLRATGGKMKNKKSLGQHWLKDRDILIDIASLAETNSIDTVVEIGPGLGTLTSALFQFFDKVIVIEKDDILAEKLPFSFPGKDLTVLHKDVLEIGVDELPNQYVLAGNIPYYITSPIVDKFLNSEKKPNKIVLLMQKEVAERIAAKDNKHSVLSLTTQARAKVELGPIVKREFFTPPPKVDSQVIILEPYEKSLVDDNVLDLIKVGFAKPRKKLLANGELKDLLKDANIDGNLRPADLSLDDWKKLAEIKHKQ